MKSLALLILAWNLIPVAVVPAPPNTDRLQLKRPRMVLTYAFTGPIVKDEAPRYWQALHNLEVNDNCAYADGHLRERCTRRMNLEI